MYERLYPSNKSWLTYGKEFLPAEPHQVAYYPTCQEHWDLLTFQEGMKQLKSALLQQLDALGILNRSRQHLSVFEV